MRESTVKTQSAVDSYFTARSSGSRSSTTFYADATKVDTSNLVDISKDVALYVVGQMIWVLKFVTSSSVIA